MKPIFKFLFLFFLSLAICAHANTTTEAATDSELLLKKYVKSWSTVDSAQRLSTLKNIWTHDGVHESPYGRSQGITAINQEIEGFQKMFPGASVTFEDIKQTGRHVVCNFIVKNPDGGVVMSGVDYFEFNEQGKLQKVVGFTAK